jgi:hypothetical protein
MRYALAVLMVLAVSLAMAPLASGVAAKGGKAPKGAASTTADAAPEPEAVSAPAFAGPLSDSLAETHKRLSQPISVDFRGAVFSGVFEDLQRRTGVQFAPNWPAMSNQAEKIRITLKATDVPVYKVLDMLVVAAPSASGWWGYEMQGGMAYALDKDGLVKFSIRNGRAQMAGAILPMPVMTGTYQVKDLVAKAGAGTDTRDVALAMYKIRDGVRAATGRELEPTGRACEISGTTLIITAPAQVHAKVVAQLASARGQMLEDPSDAAVRDRLGLVVDAVDLYGIPLATALDFLRKECNLNLEVKWDDLKKAGIDEHQPLPLQRLQNVTLERLLGAVIGGGKSASARLAWKLDKGVILISAEPLKPAAAEK